MHYRTIFISDVHLGTRDCKADLLNNFLKHNTANRLYLVGDIIAANYGENDVGGEGFNVIGTYSLSKRTSILAKYRDLTLAGSNERLTALGIHHAF